MIPFSVVKILQNLAAQSPHMEICGVIASDNSWYQVKNVASCFDSFVMDKFEYYKVLRQIKDKGETVVAIFHSHSVSPEPSEADFKFIKKSKIAGLIVTPSAYRYIHAT